MNCTAFLTRCFWNPDGEQYGSPQTRWTWFEDPAALQLHAVRPVGQVMEPPRITHDAVEPVPMHHAEPPVVGRHMIRLGADLDPGHLEAVEFPGGFVMVARDKDNAVADVGSPQELAHPA